MEAEKRKRGDGAGQASCEKSKETKGEITVTDGEVEEFYAILRRIHVAVTYLKKGNGTSLNNGFKFEDFERVDRLEERGGGEKKLEFDLNVEPDDEADQ